MPFVTAFCLHCLIIIHGDTLLEQDVRVEHTMSTMTGNPTSLWLPVHALCDGSVSLSSYTLGSVLEQGARL